MPLVYATINHNVQPYRELFEQLRPHFVQVRLILCIDFKVRHAHQPCKVLSEVLGR